MSEYDDKMKALRAELPQAYELKGQGEAGTGTITVPKGMTGEQEVKYREAVQRRMNPDIYKKLDASKKAAQEEHTKKIGKTRPTYFPKQEEDEATAYVRRAIAKVHQKEPVSGPVELSEEDKAANAQMDFDEALEDMKGAKMNRDESASGEIDLAEADFYAGDERTDDWLKTYNITQTELDERADEWLKANNSTDQYLADVLVKFDIAREEIDRNRHRYAMKHEFAEDDDTGL